MQLKIVLMRQLQKIGMDNVGLTYYCTNIRSVLSYASPVFSQFLSNTSKLKLDHVQDSATKIIETETVEFLELPTLCDFIS